MERYDICVYDSGVGGLNIFNNLLKKVNNKKVLYFADSIHSPYGNKSKHKLKKILISNIRYIVNSFNCKVVVLACNTATAVGLKILKKKFTNISFIGTYPNLNFERNLCDKILIIATKQTIKSKLINKIKEKNITKFGSKNLARLVENNFLNVDVLKYRFKQELKPIIKINFNKIVLGCTHYKFLENMFKETFINANIYDNTLIVTNNTLLELNKNKKNKINKLVKNKIYIKNKTKIKLIKINNNFKINKNNKIKVVSTNIFQELKIKKYLNLI